MQYTKIDFIKEWLLQYYSVYALTKDTERYVDSKMNDKLMNKVFKLQKKDFKKLIKEAKKRDKQVASALKKQAKLLKKNQFNQDTVDSVTND